MVGGVGAIGGTVAMKITGEANLKPLPDARTGQRRLIFDDSRVLLGIKDQ